MGGQDHRANAGKANCLDESRWCPPWSHGDVPSPFGGTVEESPAGRENHGVGRQQCWRGIGRIVVARGGRSGTIQGVHRKARSRNRGMARQGLKHLQYGSSMCWRHPSALLVGSAAPKWRGDLTMTGKPCANPRCTCAAESGKEFCSNNCREAKVGASCSCAHKGCSGKR
jgi:hypothetical protein